MSSFDLDKLQDRTLDIMFIVMYGLYIAIAFGVYLVSPSYITLIHDAIKVYVCLFLIYRFNPFSNVKCNHLDKRVAFTAGFFLLSTTIFDKIFQNVIKKTETNIKDVREKTDKYIQKYYTNLQ
jgi:hypothetical protein